MAFERFDPPGYVDDLSDAHRRKWSQWISDEIDKCREDDGAARGLSNFGPRPQFFNPLKNAPAADAVEKDIAWTAFPRAVQIRAVSEIQRWRRADSSRDLQDEYCEWSVERDPQTDKLVKVTFTSEGPEYWQFLALADPAKVVELYRQHVSPEVERAHLFQGTAYVPRNRWNSSTTDGAMHLIQGANSLRAEIELAAAATLSRRRNGAYLTAEQELIDCGSYGEPERHSDPFIGAQVNALARQGADITLANPVGLCIAGLDTAGWEAPGGVDPREFWTITRGTKEKALRAVYEVPPGRGFQVGDIKINGRDIAFGAQIADFITIKLTGLATGFGRPTQPLDGCVAEAPPAGFAAAEVSVAAALASQPWPGRR